MKISKLKKDAKNATFILEDVTPAFANSLRRIMLAEVPTLAIDNIEFFENSSALYDEMIAHRLGLVPLKTDLKSFKLPSECTCKDKGCSRCQLKFTLVKKGAGMVYSGDLKCRDKKLGAADEKIPIVKLLEGQQIKLEAIATLGQGKEHAKWQPGVISYKYYPDIKVKGAGKEAVDACPSNVLELKGNKAVVKNLENCTLCRVCMEASKKDTIEIRGLDNKFIFTIESNGSLKPEQIAAEAGRVLAAKAKEFGKELK